jgi:hypothetical protein
MLSPVPSVKSQLFVSVAEILESPQSQSTTKVCNNNRGAADVNTADPSDHRDANVIGRIETFTPAALKTFTPAKSATVSRPRPQARRQLCGGRRRPGSRRVAQQRQGDGGDSDPDGGEPEPPGLEPGGGLHLYSFQEHHRRFAHLEPSACMWAFLELPLWQQAEAWLALRIERSARGPP